MRDELTDSDFEEYELSNEGTSGLYCEIHQRPYVWDGDIEICPECEGEMLCGDEVDDFYADNS